jgi:uncharacterized protein with HEPN domain
MQPESRAFIWDARRAAGLIREFVGGRTLPEYVDDPMLRSAVERQFEIVGESLNRLSKVDPMVATTVPDLPRIVAFRNVLIHGYASIDHEIVGRSRPLE